jgi:hypothetical protein
MTEDMVLVDRKEIKAIIEDIEDRLDELEMLTDPEFMNEVKKRTEDVEKGIEGINEEEMFDMLE